MFRFGGQAVCCQRRQGQTSNLNQIKNAQELFRPSRLEAEETNPNIRLGGVGRRALRRDCRGDHIFYERQAVKKEHF